MGFFGARTFDRFVYGAFGSAAAQVAAGANSGLSLIFFSCATTSQVKVTAEVIDPGAGGESFVMVVPDSFMSDAAEADIVAELVRGQLASLGFQINDTEEKAELIVIPTLERSASTGNCEGADSECDVRSIFPTGRDKPA